MLAEERQRRILQVVKHKRAAKVFELSKLFASKRYNTKDGVIKLTPEEQQELLDDCRSIIERLDNEKRLRGLLKNSIDKLDQEEKKYGQLDEFEKGQYYTFKIIQNLLNND